MHQYTPESRAACMKQWYELSMSRLLVDMHIPDYGPEFLSGFAPENYAEMMSLADIDTVEIYAGSCLGLCNWPTRAGYPHRNTAGADLLGRTIEACRKKDLNIVVYLNVWNRKAFDEHPEWRIVLADGTHTASETKGRFGVCCINTPFRQFFLAMLAELVENYPCAGYWIDMIGWFRSHCYCDGCREKFARVSGYDEIPKAIDWNDPAWIAYQEFRRRELADFAAQIRGTVKSQSPERSLTLQCSSLLCGWAAALGADFFRQNDYLAADLYGDQYQQSMICKLFAALSPHRPIEYMVSRCENLGHHTTNRTPENLEMCAYSAIANQACFTLIDAIDPKGTLDPGFYRLAGSLNRNLRQFHGEISPDSRILADAGIFFDLESQMDLSRQPRQVDHESDQGAYRRMINLTKICQREHLTFDFITVFQLDQLARYKLVILSDCSHLDGESCEALRRYVANGGRVYASAHTSLYAPGSGLRGDFALADLFGVHWTGARTGNISYMQTGDGAPLMLELPQLRITADDDTRVTGTLTLPYSQSDEYTRFGSAISNPPRENTSEPVLVRHRFGSGECLYCSGLPESMEFDHHRKFTGNIFRSLLPARPLLTTNAPSTVEVIIYEQPAKQRLLVSMLNYPGELPPPPLYDIDFQLEIPGNYRIGRVTKCPSGEPVNFTVEHNRLSFRLNCLDKFQLIALES